MTSKRRKLYMPVLLTVVRDHASAPEIRAALKSAGLPNSPTTVMTRLRQAEIAGWVDRPEPGHWMLTPEGRKRLNR